MPSLEERLIPVTPLRSPPCSNSGSFLESAMLAAVASAEFTMPSFESAFVWAFTPKYHELHYSQICPNRTRVGELFRGSLEASAAAEGVNAFFFRTIDPAAPKKPLRSKDDRKLRRPRERRDLTAGTEIPSASAASCKE